MNNYKAAEEMIDNLIDELKSPEQEAQIRQDIMNDKAQNKQIKKKIADLLKEDRIDEASRYLSESIIDGEGKPRLEIMDDDLSILFHLFKIYNIHKDISAFFNDIETTASFLAEARELIRDIEFETGAKATWTNELQGLCDKYNITDAVVGYLINYFSIYAQPDIQAEKPNKIYEPKSTGKIAFIVCVNDQAEYSDCNRYISRLHVPEGWSVEVIPVLNASSMTSGYNQAMRSSDADIKIYIHQDVRCINRYMLDELLEIFESDVEIGMIGVAGAEEMSLNGVWWNYPNEGKYYNLIRDNGLYVHDGSRRLAEEYNAVKFQKVNVIDGVFMATKIDIPWREDIIDGWHFYDVSQSMEIQRAGYKVVVYRPYNIPWIIHQESIGKPLDDSYRRLRIAFLEEYKQDLLVQIKIEVDKSFDIYKRIKEISRAVEEQAYICLSDLYDMYYREEGNIGLYKELLMNIKAQLSNLNPRPERLRELDDIIKAGRIDADILIRIESIIDIVIEDCVAGFAHAVTKESFEVEKDSFIEEVIAYIFQDDRALAEYPEEVSYMRQEGQLMTFPYPFYKKYKSKDRKAYFDGDKGLYYVLHKGKKLYFVGDNEEEVRQTYNQLCLEQDEESPHQYFSSECDFKEGDIFVDVGAAEGIISLDVIEKASKIYLIECDDEWCKALQATFEGYEDKVQIIRKFAGIIDRDDTVRLDTLLDEYKDQSIFIKMDVEGMEIDVLKGARDTILNNRCKLSCAAYHTDEEAEEISQFLQGYGYETQYGEGYMIFLYGDLVLYNGKYERGKSPYFRRGIVRGWKDN